MTLFLSPFLYIYLIMNTCVCSYVFRTSPNPLFIHRSPSLFVYNIVYNSYVFHIMYNSIQIIQTERV